MASKSLVLLGFFALLFVVSEVAAASEKHSGKVNSESGETVKPEQFGGSHVGHGGYNVQGYGGGGCNHGCCHQTHDTGCFRCCSYAGEAVQTQPGH